MCSLDYKPKNKLNQTIKLNFLVFMNYENLFFFFLNYILPILHYTHTSSAGQQIINCDKRMRKFDNRADFKNSNVISSYNDFSELVSHRSAVL